jgi:hypothetical protein
MRVVVVVPSLAAAHQSHPPVVARVIAGFEAPASPQVRGGVDQPGGVQAQGDAQECAPKQHPDGVLHSAGEPAQAEENHAAGDQRNPVIFAQPYVKAVAAQVGRIAIERLGLRVQGVAEEQPTGVRPPSAFARGVRVAWLVAELVMDAVRGDPEHGPALESQRGADGHDVFQPLGHLVAAVRQQPVIAHSNADIDGQDVERQHDHQPLPGEEEQGRQRAHMEEGHHHQRQPVDAFAHGCGAAHANLQPRGDRVSRDGGVWGGRSLFDRVVGWRLGKRGDSSKGHTWGRSFESGEEPTLRFHPTGNVTAITSHFALIVPKVEQFDPK